MDSYDRQRIVEIKSKIFENRNEISRLYDDIKSYQEIKPSMRGDQRWEVEREISTATAAFWCYAKRTIGCTARKNRSTHADRRHRWSHHERWFVGNTAHCALHAHSEVAPLRPAQQMFSYAMQRDASWENSAITCWAAPSGPSATRRMASRRRLGKRARRHQPGFIPFPPGIPRRAGRRYSGEASECQPLTDPSETAKL